METTLDGAIQSVVFDGDLVRRLDRPGPRYTSYPTANHFSESFDEEVYRYCVYQEQHIQQPRDLSLYFHIPFCAHLCFYCACNKIVTRNRSKASTYLDYLIRELDLQRRLFPVGTRVRQLHWGGGTPTYLDPGQITTLMRAIQERFAMADETQGEYSIEVDPRTVGEETVELLRSLGFNRISIGVQDFDPRVQEKVHRVQSEEETRRVVEAARRSGFRSINVDLIYGLPAQTVESFDRTLDKILSIDPDRIALYNYAHLPHLFPPQQRIAVTDLPPPEAKLEIMKLAIMRLTHAGYQYIGMDHFAKVDDELSVAQRENRLQRNFQGYSTHAECNLVGFGISAIGMMGTSYSQNCRTLETYYQKIDQNCLPILRGIILTADDRLRRSIIHSLSCHFRISIPAIEESFNIPFKDYFSDELRKLNELEALGLVSTDAREIRVTLKGRLLVRNVCMIFDRFLRTERTPEYSRVI
jgi:oxygen-independent coproporphyrinogen-3 oxidase